MHGSTGNNVYRIDDSDITLTCLSPQEWVDSECRLDLPHLSQLGILSSLDALEGEVVYMGNDTSCTIKGIGEVWLQMYDGTIRVWKMFGMFQT